MAEVAAMTTSPEFEKAIGDATSHEQLKDIIREEAAKQGFVAPGFTPLAAHAEAAAEVKPEAKAETKTEIKPEADAADTYYDDIVIGGKTFHFEGDSAADVLRQIKAATDAHDNATRKPEEPAKKSTAEDKANLELEYRLGKIGLDEYLEKSGTLDTYLEKKGLKVNDLQDVVKEKIEQREVKSWETAKDEFLKMEGNDWAGGEQNTKILGLKLAQLGLQNDPSASSLMKAYQSMKDDGLVLPGLEVDKPVAEAAPKKKLSGSSIFGIGSGDSAKDRPAKKGSDKPVQLNIDKMSPQEIMAAFKEQAREQGMSPDEVFAEAYR